MSDPHWKDIVREEKRHGVHIKKTFQGQVLGYVTPVSKLLNGFIHPGKAALLSWHAALSQVFQVSSKAASSSLYST